MVTVGDVIADGGVYVVKKLPEDASNTSNDADAGPFCAYPTKIRTTKLSTELFRLTTVTHQSQK